MQHKLEFVRPQSKKAWLGVVVFAQQSIHKTIRNHMSGKKRSHLIWLSLLVTATLLGLYPLSKSNSFQLFGDIYGRVETEQKVVALTFDDGPSNDVDTVLAILRRNDVQATFFLVGTSIKRNGMVARRIVADGHEIGNHSYSHKRLIFRSYGYVKSEVEKTDMLIKELGYDGDIHFRPPHGKKLLITPFYMNRTSRKTIMWDIEPESVSCLRGNPEAMADYVIEKSSNGSIVLLHVMFGDYRTTLAALEKIIRGLDKRGFKFVTISELLTYDNQ